MGAFHRFSNLWMPTGPENPPASRTVYHRRYNDRSGEIFAQTPMAPQVTARQLCRATLESAGSLNNDQGPMTNKIANSK
jgi:hypothetical protein